MSPHPPSVTTMRVDWQTLQDLGILLILEREGVLSRLRRLTERAAGDGAAPGRR
jgi:hypothetical protein